MKKLTIVFAILLIGLAAQAGFSQKNIADERDDKLMLVKTTRFLEENPFDAEANRMREWGFKFLTETKEVKVNVCAGDLTKPLLDKTNKFGKDLFVQYAMGMAAYRIENVKAEETDVQLAGMESMLKAYDTMVNADETAKFAGMNILVERRDKGGLKTMIELAKCGKK